MVRTCRNLFLSSSLHFEILPVMTVPSKIILVSRLGGKGKGKKKKKKEKKDQGKGLTNMAVGSGVALHREVPIYCTVQ